MHGDAQSMVSVIVPIYNVEKYLAQCLDSILGQRHQNLEVILIDDGSTDGSPAIIDAYAARDSRVRPVHKANEGYGAGCNLGMSLANGKWISIIEPDDWIDVNMYAEMLAFADGFSAELDIVKTPWIDVWYWNDPAKQTTHPGALYKRLATTTAPFKIAEHTELMKFHPSIWSAVYRKEFLDQKGIRMVPFPGAGWADNPFLIETLCQADAIVYLDKPYYNYRCDLPDSTLNHTSDVAISRPFDRWEDMLNVIERLGIDDPRVLQAHYLRGFNYVNGAIHDDGWDNELVQKRTREVFGRMDSDLVLASPDIAPHRKRFFCDVLGLPAPKVSSISWVGHLADETAWTLRAEGPARVLARFGHIFVRTPERSGA